MGSRAVPRLLCPEVVGRDAELATAAQVTLAAAAGKGATLLVSGEAGIGKSALLQRVADTARREGLRVLRAECVRLEARRAFGPFVDALSGLRNDSDLVATALSGVGGRDPAASTPEFDRYRTHAAMERAVAALASERPLAILIDDLQWADEASLELFALISRRIAHSLLLAGTYRTDEFDVRPPLRRAVRDTARERTWEITLTPLTATDVGRALRLTLGHSAHVNATTREMLQARSGGNPLFLEEILRALAERGELTREDDGWRLSDLRSVPVPRTVRDAVRDRYRVLDPRTRDVLAAAAVVGERFTYEALGDVTSLSDSDLLEPLHRAVDAQLIVEVRDTVGTFAFRHALMRDAITEELLGRERQGLHRLVATTLERQRAEAQQIAYHFDAAGDREPAHHWHVVAAHAAVGLGAFGEALRHIDRAIELAPDDDQLVGELLMEAARAAFVLRHGEAQLRAAHGAVERFELIGDRTGLARALYQQILSMRVLGRPRAERATVLERLFEVVKDMNDTPEQALAWVILSLERRMYAERDIRAAVDAADRAVAIARRAGSPQILSVALHQAGLALSFTDLARASDALREALRLGEEHALPDRIVYALDGLAEAIFRTDGENDEYKAVMARLDKLVGRYATGDAAVSRLNGLWKSGRWDEFLEGYEDEQGDGLLWAELGLGRVMVLVAREGPDRCALLGPFVERLRAADINPTWPTTGVASLSLMLAGRYADALVALELAIPAIRRRQAFAPPMVLAGMYALIAAVAIADTTSVERWLEIIHEQALLYGDERMLPAVRQTRTYAVVERAARDGELETAIGALAQLLEERKGTLRLQPQEPQITHFLQMRYIELLLRRNGAGDRESANAQLAADVAFWRRAGAPWLLERLRERAAAWGLDFPEAPDESRHRRTPLTRRESEVAALVAQGLTNREIAERLVLSVRTAESHVEQIRAKLGFRTRAQIAAWVGETRVD